MIIAEKMKQDWNERAQHHARFWIATEDYRTEELFEQSGETTANALLEKLAGFYHPSWRVLDLGCGIGRVLKALAPHFRELVGIDVSSAMIDQSKEWLTNFPHIQTYETSGVDLKIFEDLSFNLVYSYVTFQHLPRPVFERYLGEVNRVLHPDGFLAFQLPIGSFQDVPLEDTIGIRVYPVPELEETLQRNGLRLVDRIPCDLKGMDLSNQLHHHFHLAQKNGCIKPVISVGWVQLERPDFVSDLHNHLFAVYADNCAHEGNYQEGIRALETIVKKSPDYVAGWIRLVTFLIESGQLKQALFTLREFTTLHAQYKAGHRVFQQLLQKYPQHDPFSSFLPSQ